MLGQSYFKSILDYLDAESDFRSRRSLTDDDVGAGLFHYTENN